MSKPDFLRDLNPNQLTAVKKLAGPLLVLAGAGSGKTRVITYRIANIIASGAAKPSQILAVTFTNKAAGEMKSRVINLLGPESRWVHMSTFHSFCARVLRDNCDVLGFKRGFSIYDDAESTALIKRIYKDKSIPETQPSYGTTRSRISRAKDKLITPEQYSKKADDFLENNISTVYTEYQRKLERNQAMDFDDLLMKTVQLFDKNQSVLGYYQNKYKYILIDEYQDTNHAQYRLVNLLASKNKNICVVGDDDQSIYGWRGADISNILNFEDDYPDAEVIKLEQNYRSTQNILDAAGKVVNRIPGRKSKNLFTENGTGEKITLLQCGDEIEEADVVTEKIRTGSEQDKLFSDFAILYRTNAQSRVLEDSLRNKGIPYTIVGGIRFYERAEVKDILSYLRLLVNPDDDLALTRIINTPKRGVGKTTIAKLETAANEKDKSLMSVVMNSLDELPIGGKIKNELSRFASIMSGFISKIDKLPPHEITARLINDIKYIDMLNAEGTPEAEVRADNVKELVAGIEEYTERANDPSLAGFLEEVALITDIDRWDDSAQAVTLMTLHSAKGLEFDTVLITGMEDGLFPLERRFGDSDDADEERRLCYVGITRAKKKLFLSMAGFRRRWGDYTGGPSEFLGDISPELMEVEKFNYWDEYKQNSKSYYTSTVRRKSKPKESYYEYDYEHLDTDDILQVGVRVMHDKFGAGIITSKEGSGEDLKVNVRFDRAGIKKMMVKYANLEIINN
jgi:DNA helicase-2/ATP-dependent DNA helicase PcrA